MQSRSDLPLPRQFQDEAFDASDPGRSADEDAGLLRAYVGNSSELAFAALVERYKGLVHASALRQTGDPDLAEEITQAVFVGLARKAATLRPEVILSGWLFRATRFAASNMLKLASVNAERHTT